MQILETIKYDVKNATPNSVSIREETRRKLKENGEGYNVKI